MSKYISTPFDLSIIEYDKALNEKIFNEFPELKPLISMRYGGRTLDSSLVNEVTGGKRGKFYLFKKYIDIFEQNDIVKKAKRTK